MTTQTVKRSEIVFVAGFLGCVAGITVASRADFSAFMPKLLNGYGMTVLITLSAAAISILFALVAGIAKTSSIWLVRAVAMVYAEIFRGTSLLVQLFWLFYVLPHFGINLSPLTVGILGIALNYGAYGSEIVRGAVQAVPRGQWEAVTALNITHVSALRRIVLPQAVLIMLPSYGNLMIQLVKSTSLVSFITIGDLTFEAYQLDQVTGETVTIFTIVMAAYFALSLQISVIFRWLERWFSPGMRSKGA